MAILDVGPIRGMRNVEGKLFVVAAQTLYQISNTGVAIPFGTIPGVGRVSMAHNQSGLGNELIVVNGSAGYVFDTNVNILTKITDEGYPGAFIADYIDQYLAQVEPQGRFWFHSDLANAMAYNTLDQYEAESDPDRIVSLLVSTPELFVFGKDTTEVFVNTGQQTGTFERASNTGIRIGCAAKFTPRNIDNSFMWLDDKRIVRRMDSYTPVRISTDAIDSAFQECSEAEIANCYAFTWESRGHKVYYITVPGRFTFGYDVLTRSWHRRSTWGLAHWDVVDAVYWNGRWIVGSGRYGRLYELDWDYKLDSCDPLVRRRVTGKLWDDENDLTLNNVELKFNTGGPDSVCVLFPDQPTGPSISGSPPGGSVGIPYAGYTFTVTPGDAPIARTIILTGAIPDGLSWNQYTATLSADAPTKTGLYTFTLRTIDTNGLYADLEVSIPVALLMMMLKQVANVMNDEYVLSDGYDWTGSFTARSLLDSKPFLIGTKTSFVAYGASAAHPVWTDDFGATWTEATGTQQSGVGGSRRGWYSPVADAIMLPQGAGNPCTISIDDGKSFASVILGNSNGVTALELNGITRWVSLRGPEQQITTSDDLGATATDTTVIPDSSFSAAVTLFSDGPRCYVGGRNAANTSPRIWMTEDGTNFDLETLPTLSGTAIVRIDGGLVDDVIRVVAWTELGELIIRQDDGSWTIATDQPDGIPSDAAGNGAVLAINVNKDDPADNKGIVYLVGPDGSLDERRRDTIPDTDAFTGLAALVES